MASQSTDLVQYYISEEGTYGTYVAPVSGEYMPHGTASFNDQKDMAELVATKGDVSPLQERRISKLWGGGDIAIPAGTINTGIIFGAICGQNDGSPTDNGGGSYSHAPTVANSNRGLSYSIGRIDTQDQRHYVGARLGSATVTSTMNGDPLFWETNWVAAEKSTQSDVTPAYSDETFFYPDMVTLDIVDEGDAFGTTDYPYESISITFDFALDPRGKGGSTSLNEVFRSLPFTITGSITTLKEDETDYQEAFTNQEKAIRLVASNGTESFTIDLLNLVFDNPTTDTGLSTMETMTRTFSVNNAVNNVAFDLTNGQAAYPLT